jgi:hypothetical protein
MKENLKPSLQCNALPEMCSDIFDVSNRSFAQWFTQQSGNKDRQHYIDE